MASSKKLIIVSQLTKHKQVTSAQFPELCHSLLAETCCSTVESLFSV